VWSQFEHKDTQGRAHGLTLTTQLGSRSNTTGGVSLLMWTTVDSCRCSSPGQPCVRARGSKLLAVAVCDADGDGPRRRGWWSQRSQ
jgi:hypothetical protein